MEVWLCGRFESRVLRVVVGGEVWREGLIKLQLGSRWLLILLGVVVVVSVSSVLVFNAQKKAEHKGRVEGVPLISCSQPSSSGTQFLLPQ